MSTYDFSALYAALPRGLIGDRLVGLVEGTSQREGSPYLACNDRSAFFAWGGGGGHSAMLLTFIKLPFVIKIFALSIFEWLLKTGFTVLLFIDQFCPRYLISSAIYFVILAVLNNLTACHFLK